MKYYVYKNGNEFVTNKMSTDYLHTLYRNYPLHFNYTQLGKYIYAYLHHISYAREIVFQTLKYFFIWEKIWEQGNR